MGPMSFIFHKVLFFRKFLKHLFKHSKFILQHLLQACIYYGAESEINMLLKIKIIFKDIIVIPLRWNGPHTLPSKIWFRLNLNMSRTPRQHERYITYKLRFSRNNKAVLPNWSKSSLRRQGKKRLTNFYCD